MARPKVDSLAQRELNRLDDNFKEFHEEVKSLSDAPRDALKTQETEEQTKLSKKEVREYDAPVIKPKTTLGSREKFDSAKYGKLRAENEEYIKVIVENKEIIGETVCRWHKDMPGQDCTEWEIPVNRPVYIWRGVAKRLSECKYRRLIMNEADPMSRGAAQGGFTAGMVADTMVQRIDCRKVENF